MGLNGFIQDIFRTIFQKNGYKTKFVIVPWLRALNTFNEKMPYINGMIGMKAHSIKKEIAIFPEEEIARYTHRFYALKDSPLVKSWKYQGVESLKDITIGCVMGWNYCDNDITEYLKKGNTPYIQALTGTAPAERNFKKLLARRIDLWIANINNTEYLLSKKRKAGNKEAEMVIGFLDLPITTEVNVYPVFYRNEEGERFSKIFTQGIRELRKTGELDTILVKYGLTDWK